MWGVRDENTWDHLTWMSCLRELERCEEESLGVFFLSLQSHKYGYCPLPKFISKSNFESKCEDPTLTPEWLILVEITILEMAIHHFLHREEGKARETKSKPI